MNGKLFILSGPSAVGKTTIGLQVHKLLPQTGRIVTYTTRPKRPGEKNGVHYNFVTPEKFDEMVKNDEFLEWAWVHKKHRYGTPKNSTIERLHKGESLLYYPEVQGALNLREQLPAHTVLMFLMPEKIDYKKQGKKNRASGLRFEAKVRSDLEKMGWIVDKWTNTVDYEKWKLVPAKRKYNPFRKVMVIGTGFPDFISIRKQDFGYEVVGVEVKQKGYLDKIEKGMCQWILENKIFSRILIAKKGKKRGEVEYVDFEKYIKKSNKK